MNALQHRNWISRLTLAVLSALLLIAARPVQAQTLTVLYNFTGGSDGGGPDALLTLDDEGNLYGTTEYGGAGFGFSGFGTAFELSPNGSGGWNESVLYTFSGGADGAYPEFSNVIFDDNGNLYGTTGYGGANGDGVVFELSPAGSSWTETVLYNFAGGITDGANPINGLIMDQAGNLYGITVNGGTAGGGTVFELSPPSGGSGPWTEQVIYNVLESNESFPPGLTMNDGNIYGTSDASVFELSPNGSGGWNPTVIYKTGGTITGTPAFYQGNLYAETQAGGSGFGTVFELIQENGVWQSKAHLLTSKAGSAPEGGLVFDAVGDIYGITYLGGLPEAGNLFELVNLGDGHYKTTSLETFNFTDEEGYNPEGGLLQYNGSLYGTNATGPESGGYGAAFAVTLPGANTVTTLTSSPNPSNFGESVTFTAVVTDILGGSPPDGEAVSFMKGKTILGTGTLSGGAATFAISTLKVGTTSVKAVYAGDLPDFQGSTSKPVKQVVN
jgi:uncharacterized repeat protein (TIGR03803 family)